MKLVINNKQVSFANNERPQPMLFTVAIVQILANNSHNRNTMHASRQTQFVFVTLNVFFLTVLFVAVNRNFLETELKLINQLSMMN